jgi:type V secretory pathway adhesin AidA
VALKSYIGRPCLHGFRIAAATDRNESSKSTDDGHGGESNLRIVKFSKAGKLIKHGARKIPRQSDGKNNPGVKRGIRIVASTTAKQKRSSPGFGSNPETLSVAEGVADPLGNVYGAATNAMIIRKFIKSNW